MREKVVNLGNFLRANRDADHANGGDLAREYIIDMVEQLAHIAREHDEPLLGAMLDEVLQRHGPLRRNDGEGQSSSGGAPG